MNGAYSIKLPVFEGPFDLLLHLIHENKIDIYDIPIAEITRQYLDYLELMKELDLEIAGEFLVMAATLIHIKSRLLLPIDESTGADEIEDPRLELVQRLIEYQAFKEVSLALREREEEQGGVFRRVPQEEEATVEEEMSLFDINLFDLLNAFKKLIEKAPLEAITITRESLTVKDKMSLIIEVLEGKKTVRFEELFEAGLVRQELVVTFIALLELLRLGLARVYQEKEFGTIWVMRPESHDIVPAVPDSPPLLH